MPTYPLSKKQAAWELDQVIRILTHSAGLPARTEFDITELRLQNPFDGEMQNTTLRHTWDESWSWDQLEQEMGIKDWEFKPIVMENQFHEAVETPAQIRNQPRLQVYSSEITHAALIQVKEGMQGNQLGALVSLTDPKPQRPARYVMTMSSLVSANQAIPSPQQVRLQDPILMAKEVEDLFSHEFVNDSVYWVGGEAHSYSGPLGFESTVQMCQSLNSVQLQQVSLHPSPAACPIQGKSLVATTPMDLAKKTKRVVLKIGGEHPPTTPFLVLTLLHFY